MSGVSNERALWLSRQILPHEPALRAWLKHKGTAGLDPDDIVQEAYARLAALESVEFIRHPKNYLFQAAYSIIVSHLRRSRVVTMDQASDVDNLRVTAETPSAEQQVAHRQELRLIAEAIASLPLACRQVLVLRRVEGLSQREVAGRLGLSENSVEHHMGRAVRLLMDIFGRGGKQRPQASISPNKGDSRFDDPAANKSGG